MATARREYFGKLLEPGLSDIFYEVFDEIPVIYPELYTVKTTDQPYEEDLSIGSLGDFPEFKGVVEYDRMYQGYSKVYEFPEYAKGFQIERKLYDDEKYNIINTKPVGLATRAARKKEQHAASLFNNAFSASFLGPDGKRLCATDHPSKAYVDAGEGPQNRSNVGTLALSHSALQTTKNLMRDTRDDRNFRISVVPDILLVPPAQEELAWSLNQAETVINSSDKNPNIHQGRYKLIVWDELTNDDAWFLIDSRYMKMFLKWFDRVPIEFAMEEEFDTLVAKFRAYMRYDPGWSDWVWIFGNDAS
jgi:phage major head subunit gpT-like protein